MTLSDIEKRLTAIESTLARLTGAPVSGAGGKSHPVQMLEQIHGRFEEDEAFREAMRLGRRWREGQRPRTRKAKAKGK